MRRNSAGTAAAALDEGLRRVTRLTWRAAAFGYGVASQHAAGGDGTTRHGRGTILIRAQPPAPASGSGQATSGAS